MTHATGKGRSPRAWLPTRLVAFAMIEAIGDVSGAHMNPAVSVGFALAGRFPWRQVPG